MNQHNNLFFTCDNCNHPIILSREMELGVLDRTRAITCEWCEFENTDLKEFKEYAKQSRNYSRIE